MQFFTQIGIDWRLLVAQIINFVILLLLLSKFLYQPVIKKIQEDEQKRREVDEARQAIEKEKEAAKQHVDRELTQAKEQSRKIIADAARLADALKSQTSSEQQKLNARFLKQLKEETASLSQSLEEKITKRERGLILRKTMKMLDKTLDAGRKEAIEKMFFERLIESIHKARFSPKHMSLPIRLEYAVSLSKEEFSRLEKLLCEKLHVTEVHIEKKKNSQLISGINLQVAGTFFSQNIADSLQIAA